MNLLLSHQWAVNILAILGPVRPSTFVIVLLMCSTWIWLYARKAVQYHVWSLMIGTTQSILLIGSGSMMSSLGREMAADPQQLLFRIDGHLRWT